MIKFGIPDTLTCGNVSFMPLTKAASVQVETDMRVYLPVAILGNAKTVGAVGYAGNPWVSEEEGKEDSEPPAIE